MRICVTVSSSDDDLRVKIDSLKSKRSQELSSVVVDATPSGVEEYGNAALEDDVSNNGNLSSEIQVSSMENVDRRRVSSYFVGLYVRNST